MKVTLKQIAERTGVSINTVSMVLRGMSGISAPTRERVRRAAVEMGYLIRNISAFFCTFAMKN